MSVNLHTMKEAEARAKTSLMAALNSTLVIYGFLLIIVVFGFVLAQR